MTAPIYNPHRVTRSRHQASKVKKLDLAYGIFAGSVLAAILMAAVVKVVF